MTDLFDYLSYLPIFQSQISPPDLLQGADIKSVQPLSPPLPQFARSCVKYFFSLLILKFPKKKNQENTAGL